MAFYSDEVVEEVRNRTNIVDVISQYVNLQKKGSQYFGLCPFHNEKTGSFSVSPQKQMYYCFGCGKGGNVFSFLMDYENMTFKEAVEELAPKCGVTLPQRELTPQERQRADRRSRLFEINKDAAAYYYKMLRSDAGKQAMDYFTKRELTPDTMHKFGLGCTSKYSDSLYKYLRGRGYEDDILKDCGLITIDEKRGGHDKFWNRAMFPIFDANGKVVAFGGRVMGDGEPKYLNSPETEIFNKSKTLFGLYFARKTRREQFILCEGYMDVISLHQAGFDNAVASLGTALTEGHAGMLKRYVKDVYLSYDSDGAGQKAALRAIPILKNAGISCRIINMSPYKDPDEFIKNLGAEEYEKRIQNAENSFMYQVRMLQNNYDMTDPEKKSDFQKEAARMIVMEFSTQLERENYTESVAAKFNIPKDALAKYILELGQSGITARRDSATGDDYQKKQLKPKDDGMKMSQRLLLTWLVETPDVYPKISLYVNPQDFEAGVYRTVAEEVFKYCDEGNPVDTARIVDLFMEDEERKTVAALFNTTVGELTENSDLSKALKETLLRIKKNSLELAQKNGADLKSLVEGKKTLQRLERLDISL
ncbi:MULTISPECIES: DNA primase [Pseudobutyrivibrio]|uniref:DNA primase n=1 Tax=Pseudobutyrivibrio xylanivorans TaxID=185007 RepID=A0A1G5S294_PSEXY|nr:MULTISPECIES: DNA primase [Pseudobutyrivibrio]MDC7279547.1 DNA primase [Butyrivibrio fibrisolvens]SCZ79960.1 DNA primase [Pseudobutyrivibrio xylanivorans]